MDTGLTAGPFEAALEAIQAAAERFAGDADGFAEHLRRERLPHLSFTSLASVEACPRRYWLEYVQGCRLEPPPRFFVKGKLFHRMAQAYYRGLQDGGSSGVDDLLALAGDLEDPQEGAHLRNAASLLDDHAWRGWRVAAVEQPFVMSLGPDLPPCVGVIDLIVEHAGTAVLVDHKTGRTFTPHDPLQMAIYREALRRQAPDRTYRMVFDNYRWVNHLGRIRTPAFWREEVGAEVAGWDQALERLRHGYAAMRQIILDGWAPRLGACFRCLYRGVC